MKKLFSFALMATALLISGQMKADVAKIGNTSYATMTAALNAVDDGQTIVLINHVPSGSMSEELDIWDGDSITIDLNGYNFATAYRFRVAHGTLKITGKGTITSSAQYFAMMYGSYDPEKHDYSNLIIDKDVVITAAKLDGTQLFCPIAITAFKSDDVLAGADKLNYYTIGYNGDKDRRAFGVVVKIYGKLMSSWYGISVNGQVRHTDGYVPEVYIYEGAVVSDYKQASGNAAIYAAGYVKWFIYGTLSGATGIYAKAGEFEITDATITATGDYQAPVADGDGFDANGMAIVIDSHSSYAGGVKLTVDGDSKIESQKGSAVLEVITAGGKESTQKITLNSGTFTGGQDQPSISVTETLINEKGVEVAGGTYSTNVDNYVDKTTGSIVLTTVDKNGEEVFVVSKSKSGEEVSWKTEWNNIQSTDFVKFETDWEANQNVIDITEDASCEYLAILGNDSVTLKAGKRLVAGEIVLNDGSRLVVEPGATLLVTGDKGLYSPNVDGFIIKANSTARGLFAFNPHVSSNKSPYATVEYYTTAHYRTATNDYKLDIFSFPFVKGTLTSVTKSAAIGTNYQHVVNGSWVEFANQNDFMAKAEPFEAIAFTNNGTQDNVTYTFKGQLQGNISGKLNLKAGFNYIGNPFMAPMTSSDIIINAPAQVDKYIAIWTGKGYLGYNSAFSSAPNMNPMNMFVIWAKEDVTAEFNYETLIWNNVK